MSARIVTLPGDGIGPEIMAPTLTLLGELGTFEFEEHVFGGASIDAHGVALTDETLAAAQGADAVLLGAVGGPRWDTTDPAQPRPEQGLLGLRKGLGLYANLRPVKPLAALYDSSPLRRERIEGTDMLVVRELTGGIYFGAKERSAEHASDECRYTVAEIERIARTAFGAADQRPGGSRVSSVDKANVLETSRLWREVVGRVHAAEFPHIELEHVLVDNAAMQLVAAPRHFDVLLTDLRMPVMDGIELLQHVAKLPDHQKPSRIIAISGEYDAGVLEGHPVQFVAKPFDVDTLLAPARIGS